MAFWLLGAERVDVPAIAITAETDGEEEERIRGLRETAKTLHHKWLQTGSVDDKRRFARALIAWAKSVGEMPAYQHGRRLLTEGLGQ